MLYITERGDATTPRCQNDEDSLYQPIGSTGSRSQRQESGEYMFIYTYNPYTFILHYESLYGDSVTSICNSLTMTRHHTNTNVN